MSTRLTIHTIHNQNDIIEVMAINDLGLVNFALYDSDSNNEAEVCTTRSESLQITKHLIQQFGFTEEELRDGK